VAFVLILTIFHRAKAKTFSLASFLAKKKKMLARWQASFFSFKKARHTKSFCLRKMKNRQHQHNGKPHIQAKS
jgi:hypothetical protein